MRFHSAAYIELSTPCPFRGLGVLITVSGGFMGPVTLYCVYNSSGRLLCVLPECSKSGAIDFAIRIGLVDASFAVDSILRV